MSRFEVGDIVNYRGLEYVVHDVFKGFDRIVIKRGKGWDAEHILVRIGFVTNN